MDRGERKWIWEPTREWIEQTNVYRFMQRLGIGDREELTRFSQEHLEEFWPEMAAEVGRWSRPDDLVLDTSRGGDWASVDEDGCWFLHGRSDESMNVAGRKVGPAEVEDALMEHPAVAEAAVIGVPDAIKGETIVGFVVLKKEYEASETLCDAVAKQVVESLGPTFRAQAIQFVPALPKTQSGKVVRRLIRLQYLGLELGDTSTVENPGSLESFRRTFSTLRNC